MKCTELMTANKRLEASRTGTCAAHCSTDNMLSLADKTYLLDHFPQLVEVARRQHLEL